MSNVSSPMSTPRGPLSARRTGNSSGFGRGTTWLPLFLSLSVVTLHLSAIIITKSVSSAQDDAPKIARALLRPSDARPSVVAAPSTPSSSLSSSSFSSHSFERLFHHHNFSTRLALFIETSILKAEIPDLRVLSSLIALKTLSMVAVEAEYKGEWFAEAVDGSQLNTVIMALETQAPRFSTLKDANLCTIPACAAMAGPDGAKRWEQVQDKEDEVAGQTSVLPQPPPPSPHELVLPDGRRVDNRFSHQTCYLGGDESEICEYHGTVCFDGEGPVVITDDAKPGKSPLDPIPEVQEDCMDFRFNEPSTFRSSGCMYSAPGGRAWPYGDRAPIPSTDHSLELSTRYFGPLPRRDVPFKQAAPSDVFPSPEEGWGTVDVLTAKGGSRSEPLPGLRISASSKLSSGVTVDFLEGALWLPVLHNGRYNPYAWLTSISQLYTAQRANASAAWGQHPNDGWLHRQLIAPEYQGREISTSRRRPTNTTTRWVSGPQWGPFPPMDTVMFVGNGATEVASAADLQPWMAMTLPLALQNHSRAFFADGRAVYNSSRLLCARRAVTSSFKPKVFSSSADAWLFRQYAYQVAKVPADTPPHPKYPPRQITIMDRQEHQGRYIFNLDDVSELAHATGLTVEYVYDMGNLKPDKQVALMARTGILIAPHGAALSNAIFLPAHAVVIELHPPLHQRNTYADIARVAGLRHMAIHTRDVLPPKYTAVYGSRLMAHPDFRSQCVEGMNKMSSFDAALVQTCNAASKAHPLIVPQRALRRALVDAVDAIGVPWLDNKLAQLGKAQGSDAVLGPDPDVEQSTTLKLRLERALDKSKARQLKEQQQQQQQQQQEKR